MDQINIALAAILDTAAEIDPEPMPLGPAYAAISAQGYSWDNWQVFVEMLRRGGMASIGPETLTLTALGREVVAKIAALRNEVGA